MTVQNNRDSRREFLKRAGSLLLASSVAVPQTARAKPTLPNPVGYAAISWPRDEFDDALVDISALGFQGIQMLGWVQKSYGQRIETIKARLNILKLKPAALSCSGLSPGPTQTADESSQLRSYATFMKLLGGKNLQITDGGRPDIHYTAGQIKSLGDRMNHLGKLAQDSGLVLGYRPHFDTLGETRQGLDGVLASTDSKYVKLIADVAHLALGGCNPAEVIRTYHERMLFLHLKDVRKDVLALARKNRNLVRKSTYLFCEIGQGGVNFPAILHAMREVSFSGWVIIELDAYQSRPGGPAESARMNRDAARQMGFRV